MKTAITHDWLVGGGAEKVVEQLHKIYPDAPIYTSYATDEWRKRLGNKVITGYLQKWPFSALRKFLPVLRNIWFKHLDLSEYDLVISSSGNGEAKNIRVKPGAVHICYCHTPTHFYWRHYDTYLHNPGFGVFNPLAHFGLRLLVKPLRRADYKAAQKVDFFIANSSHIQADIKKYYGKDSKVIHPPINADRFKNSGKQDRKGFITVGRLVPYKHVEIIIEACAKLALPLTVVGNGPELHKLQNITAPTVTFDSTASDEAVNDYMKNAEGFIFAAHEDFGITPVEALAAGTPVIAYKAGGALDYVTSANGMFFEKQTVGSLMNALERFQAKSFDHSAVTKSAERFNEEAFRKNFKEFVAEATK
jgi:glycosyltransferase involved in cell wall biosynthesis